MSHGKYIYFFLPLLLLGCKDDVINPIPTKPVVRIVSPTYNSIICQYSEIIVEATDDQRITRVQIFVNHSIYYTSDSTLSQHKLIWRPEYSTIDSNQYVIEAVAYDNEGNKTISAPLIVYYFNFTPQIKSIAVLSDTLLKLEWVDNSKIESGFEIERAVDDSNFVHVLNVDSNITSALISDSFKTNTNYYFRMRAFNAILKSPYSQIKNLNLTLGAPYWMSATLNGDSSVKVSWSDTNSVKHGFIISVADSKKNVSQYTYSTSIEFAFKRGIVYTVKVSALKNNVEGPAKSTTVLFNLEPPANLKVPNEFSDKVVLKWDDKSKNEKGFVVYRAMNSGTPVEIGRIDSNITEYTDRNLDTNVDYKYSVNSFSKYNESLPSNELSTTYNIGLVSGTQSYFIKNFLDGTFSGDFNFFFKNNGRTVSMYKMPQKQFVREFEIPPDTQYSALYQVISSFDGSKVSRGYSITNSYLGIGNRIGIWNSNTGGLDEFYNTNCIPNLIGFSNDNSKIILKDCNNIFANHSPGGSSAIVYSNESGFTLSSPKHDLLFLSLPNFIKIFRVSDGSLLKTILSFGNETLLGCSPDGKYLITTKDLRINVYNLDSASIVYSETLLFAKAAHMPADSKVIFVISWDSIHLLDISSKKVIKTYATTEQIYHTAFFCEQNRLAIATKSYLTYYELKNFWVAYP